VEGEGRGIF